MRAMIMMVCCCSMVFSSDVSAGPVEGFKRDILQAISIVHGSADSKFKQESIWNLVDPLFDEELIIPRVLKKTWPQLTPAEKEQLLPFAGWVIKWKIIGKLFKYDVGNVCFTGERQDGETIRIRAKLKRFPVGYPAEFVLVRKGDGWAACDLLIGGFSVIEHYRRKFDKTYFKEGFESLRDHLDREVTEEFREIGLAAAAPL